MKTPTTLVATLGGKPQLVTFMLDILLAQGEPISQVIVVYPARQARSQAAFERLECEFAAGSYNGQPLQSGGHSHAGEVEAVRHSTHELLYELKQQRWRSTWA
jgi:CRISPR-associated protein Csx14